MATSSPKSSPIIKSQVEELCGGNPQRIVPKAELLVLKSYPLQLFGLVPK
ncbi:hypothetical protein H6G76_06175 [Nostoc sp. FACHB-152]|nr:MULTISPECIES: hypothetical protein [unclassified Nostoc]MBD2446759.1 hypothetical protein [Nostoc sp. FACHB-152]